VSLLAVLLSMVSLGTPAMEVKPRECVATTSIGAAAYTRWAKETCKAKPKPGADTPSTNPGADAPGTNPGTKPEATPTPGATATPTPTPEASPTPAPPGTYPTRTNVDLTDIREWSVRPSYRILAAGQIDFNANNRGEDDHNLTVRDGARDLGRIDLAPGDTGTLTVELGLGTYTLYCSLPLHEEAGMKATISVR
jgi:plastocyanin